MKQKYWLQCVGDGCGFHCWRLLDVSETERVSIRLTDWIWTEGERDYKRN